MSSNTAAANGSGDLFVDARALRRQSDAPSGSAELRRHSYGPTAEGDSERFAELREQAFFPVREAPLQLRLTGEPVREYRALLADDEDGKGQVLSVVSKGYHLLLNEEVCELARRLFARVFGDSAAAVMYPMDWRMPEGRASLHVDFTARGLRFFENDGGWQRIFRASNSYNKTCQVRFTVGVVRLLCGNGMVFRDVEVFQNLHTHTMEEWIEKIDEFEFGRRDLKWLDAAHIRRSLERLASLPVPAGDFLAGMARALGLKPPDTFDLDPSGGGIRSGVEPPTPKQQRHWAAVARCLHELSEKYRREHGDNAFALLNAASEYASRSDLPGMHAGRVTSLQRRCGRMLDELDRPNSVVRLDPEDWIAARRLRNAAGRGGGLDERLETREESN